MGKKRRAGRRAAPPPGTAAPATSARGAHGPAPTTAPPRTRIALALGLASLVALVYWRALAADFLNWDDDVYVTDNPHVTGLSWSTVRWAFTTTLMGNWIPLTWLSHALDGQLHGLEPFGHHLTSVALHVANTVLVFAVFEALTGATWPSAALAALFGLHPLHVESVAWVSERKDVLSTLFWLLAMAAYARYVRVPTTGPYLAVAAAYLAGLLSKPMVITLPLVLLLLDHWPLRRLSWATVREKAPLFALMGVAALWTFVAQQSVGAITSGVRISFGERLANALVAYVRYLALTLWPSRLSPYYSHPAVEGPPLAAATVAGAAVLLLVVSGVAVASLHRRPYVTVGWAWYVVTLLPVIGLVQIGGQAMADRYTYVPHLGLFALVVWSLAALPIWQRPAPRSVAAALVALALGALAVRTWQYVGVWRDPVTLWTRVLAVNPKSMRAYYNLGNWKLRNGEHAEASRLLRHAVELSPLWIEPRHDLGAALFELGEYEEAAEAFRQILRLDPEFESARDALALVLDKQREVAEKGRAEDAGGE